MTDKRPPEGKRIMFSDDSLILQYDTGYNKFRELMGYDRCFFSNDSTWGDIQMGEAPDPELAPKVKAITEASGLSLITRETPIWLICMQLQERLDEREIRP